MKFNLYLQSLLGLTLLCLPVVASAQAPATLTLPVNDTVFLYGIPYHATGVLTLTPIDTTTGTLPVTVPIPPPTPTPVVIPPPVVVTPPNVTPVGNPQVFGYRDNKRNPSVGPLVAGSVFYVEGQNFGPTPGTVTWNNVPLVVQAWQDKEISLILPSAPTDALPGSLTVNRPDGTFVSVIAFALLAPP